MARLQTQVSLTEYSCGTKQSVHGWSVCRTISEQIASSQTLSKRRKKRKHKIESVCGYLTEEQGFVGVMVNVDEKFKKCKNTHTSNKSVNGPNMLMSSHLQNQCSHLH